MLKLIKTNALPAISWKNGGGLTREIAQAPGPNGFAWRLSMADVVAEGPFSRFAGMSRILTVIEGDGLKLRSLEQVHDVPRYLPFQFSGETEIHSTLGGGKIRDFNVIYDPDIIAADVRVLTGSQCIAIKGTADTIHAVFGITGAFSLGGQPAQEGDFAFVQEHNVGVDLPDDCKVLIVRLENQKQLGF